MANDISLAILHSKIGYQIHTFIFPLFITHSNNNPCHNCSIQSLIFHVQLLCRKKRTSMKENILQKKLWFKELARLWVVMTELWVKILFEGVAFVFHQKQLWQVNGSISILYSKLINFGRGVLEIKPFHLNYIEHYLKLVMVELLNST